MSPKVLKEGMLIFWFHSYDALHESRASIHIGKGTQDDVSDAKIWLEPNIEVARPGRTLRRHELNRALNVVKEHRRFLLEKWHDYRNRTS